MTDFFQWLEYKVKDESGKVVGKVSIKSYDLSARAKGRVKSVVLVGDKVIIETKEKFDGWVDQVKLYDKAIKSIEVKTMEDLSKKEKVIFT